MTASSSYRLIGPLVRGYTLHGPWRKRGRSPNRKARGEESPDSAEQGARRKPGSGNR